jgi:osmoprotectant transport system substrate-binding protein
LNSGFHGCDPLIPILKELGGKVSAEQMRRMNYAVDGEHHDVKEVVRDFLRGN